MAPEMLEGKNIYGYKCDLWSIGIIIYQLFFKEYPYKGETQVAIYKQIEKLGKTILKKTKNLKLDNLINSLLTIEPEKRINYEEYFNHPFFKENSINNSSIYNNNNINKANIYSKNRSKTSTNLLKKKNAINTKEAPNYNNSPFKLDYSQSFSKIQPKLYKKNNKIFHQKFPNIKQSETRNKINLKYYNNNHLKAYINQSFSKMQLYQENNKKPYHHYPKMKRSVTSEGINLDFYNNHLKTDRNQTFSRMYSNQKNNTRTHSNPIKKQSIIRNTINLDYYNNHLKNDINQSFSKIQPYQENNRRTYHNSPIIKQSVVDKKRTSNYDNTLKIYVKNSFPKMYHRKDDSFNPNFFTIKQSKIYDKLSSNYYENPLKTNLSVSFSNINSGRLIPKKVDEQIYFSNKKKESKDYLNRVINTENSTNNFTLNQPQKKTRISINIKYLMFLEEKLKKILISIKKNETIHDECLILLDDYYNYSFCGKLVQLFKTENDKNIVQISINHIFLSAMICYDYSNEMKILKNETSNLFDIMYLNYSNLIIIYELIINIVNAESNSNLWVYNFNKLVKNYKNSKNNDNSQYILDNGRKLLSIAKIKFNVGIITERIRILLKYYKTKRNEYLVSIFKKIDEKSYEEIYNFFIDNILRKYNTKDSDSDLNLDFLKDNENFQTEPAPYIKVINTKLFSLILDLDETLVHFKINNDDDIEGILQFRPGVIPFLEEVGKYYELIVFTEATQDYGDLLIDALEENRIYFEQRFYRQHTVIIDNDFVKDLNRIGRPLDKMIIVDDMPKNFRLQKENGIHIKAFRGKDAYDNALKELGKILVNIAKEGGDVRIGIERYKDEIFRKVTLNISKINLLI